MKKIVSIILAVCLLTGAASAAFTDVSGHWAEEYIDVCCELGLMEGVSDESFDPDGGLTVAQGAAIAARRCAYLGGEDAPAPGEPWYEPYMEYMEELGCDLPDPGDMCTRAVFFEMMSAAVPEKKLAPINNISRVPDSDDESLMVFYNAGILTGMDEYGTFRGELGLTRAECAAMAARIADYTLRVRFKPAAWENSASMQCLSLPPEAAALTIGGEEVSAADFTAALTHELEVIAAEYQLESHPDYQRYLDMWSIGGYAQGFERYLSEVHGVNDFTPVDWNAENPDTGLTYAETALERAVDSLKYSVALAKLAAERGIELTGAQLDAIETAADEFDGESRQIYAENTARDALLLAAIAGHESIGADTIRSMLAGGEWVCAEFAAFSKTDSNGEPLGSTDLGYIRAGGEALVSELGDGQQHYRLEYMLSYVKSPFTAPRCTLWNEDMLGHDVWQRLKYSQSGVFEDDENIYLYLVSDPFFDEGLTAEVGANYGADQAAALAEARAAALECEYGEEIQMLAVDDFAAKVI